MGEAKSRQKREEAFRARLTPGEIIVMDTALAVHRKFLVPSKAMGMCYRMSFFLAEYLLDRYDIKADPNVGYINDGEGEIMTSHAWLVFNGKKTDISLTRTNHPSVPTGALLILDRPFTTGAATYTYHDDRSAAGLMAAMKLMEHPKAGPILQHKETEHAQMKALEKNSELRRVYLDKAPDGLTFDRLAAIIEAG